MKTTKTNGVGLFMQPLSGEAMSRSTRGRKHEVVSLFSGCGGLDLGFLGGFEFQGRAYGRLPFEVVWANDIDVAACETYRNNIGEIHCGDIRRSMKHLPDRADIVIGGFPCQDVSVNGLGMGKDGERTNLYKAMRKVIQHTNPKMFVAENVKGLLSDKHTQYRQRILRDFESLGYHVSCELYLAANYGVPQMRERVFIVGTSGKSGAFTPPAPTHSRADWVTSRETIRDLESKAENRETAHIWSKARRNTEQGSRTLKADKPADTIRAECHGNIQFHYRLSRRISMREAARFQSIPDDFAFSSGIRQMERQIGNAVPPVLAWHIAKATQRALS